ncbi:MULTISPECIES: hypothetical protein [Xanthomonas]|uniref:hypothetical protein n=1 Tax=Xanthomonas TaxID=338 RepID=UPI000E5A9CFD|nr:MULTISPECIES: hypothetical protein [Xanthomonas]CAD1792108.1 hypothetical protein XSP_002181 [Xanthomonas sp. CPBF 426]CAG2090363.1 hypothetical protein XCY_002143 [Xanthomonas euroxanthea]
MQALSQLSYGPTMLRAGNHSDIDDAWEVVRAKKDVLSDLPVAGSAWRVQMQACDAFQHRRLMELDVAVRGLADWVERNDAVAVFIRRLGMCSSPCASDRPALQGVHVRGHRHACSCAAADGGSAKGPLALRQHAAAASSISA